MTTQPQFEKNTKKHYAMAGDYGIKNEPAARWYLQPALTNHAVKERVMAKANSSRAHAAHQLYESTSLPNGNQNRQYHGLSKTKLYRIWVAMKRRCYETKNSHYKNYGARGVMVCQEWISDFLAFRTWAIAAGYADGLDMDRIDNNGSYTPSNCRFVTRSQNLCNRRAKSESSSKYRGVSWASSNKKWRAAIGKNRVQILIGYFEDELSAALAYDNAARGLHGEFASPNFPEITQQTGDQA